VRKTVISDQLTERVEIWPSATPTTSRSAQETLKLIDRFNGIDMSLWNEMGSHYAQELTRVDDLGLLPILREMPLIAGNEVVGAGGVGTFDKHVVVRVAGHFKAARLGDNMAVVLDKLQQLLPDAPANMKVRTWEHARILLQDLF
jgi:hypothetical protein